MRRVAAAIAAALTLGTTPVAHGQPAGTVEALTPADREQAERYFSAGKAAYRSGQYLVAARAFDEALQRAPLPEIAFSLAQALRRQYFVDGDLAKAQRALELYRWYLDRVPSGKRRPHAVTHIASLEVVTARLEQGRASEVQPPTTEIMVVSATPGAAAAIDGGPERALPAAFEVEPGEHEVRVVAAGHEPTSERWLAVESHLVVAQVDLRPVPGVLAVRASGDAVVLIDGRAPDALPARVPPGEHTVTVTRRGHRPLRTVVTLPPGGTVEVLADLVPTRRRTASYYTAAGAGALLLSGLTTTVLAFSSDGRAADLQRAAGQRNLTGEEREALDDAIDRRDDLRTTSATLLGGAIVVGAVAAALYFGDEPALGPSISSESAGVTYLMRF